MFLLQHLALALDTLPPIGRVLLLALLLAGALYGFARLVSGLRNEQLRDRLELLYSKGALLALLAVPAMVLLLDVRVPVPVAEYRRLDTPWPGYAAYAVLAVVAIGAVVRLVSLLGLLRATLAVVDEIAPAPAKLAARVDHWRARLNLPFAVDVRCGGAELPWHVGTLPLWRHRAVVILPAAAANWPVGTVDVLMLVQLSQLQQRGWRWLLVGRLICALYWFAPWIATIERCLADALVRHSVGLAHNAYRDPDGWRRDGRNAARRGATLQAVPLSTARTPLRLSSPAAFIHEQVRPGRAVLDDAGFEQKWAGSRQRQRAKHADPYEQAYWLIAVASILVGIASTLTLRPAAPEFEPGYLNVKWQDQMVRRLHDDEAGWYPEEPDQE